MTIKELRSMTGLTQHQFSDKYGIPFRTIQNWEGGQRSCPDYLINLLERAVKEDIKEERKMAIEKLKEMYGAGYTITIKYNGESIIGNMYGNDECFDLDRFYQYFVSDNMIYKAYYDASETALDCIDYTLPDSLEETDF